MTLNDPRHRSFTKVVHVSSVHALHDTRILHREAASAARAGYQTVLVTGHNCDETFRGVQIRGFQRPAGRFGRMLGGVAKVYQLAVQEGPAIFHLHDPELLTVVPLLRLRGWPVIYDAHEVLPHQILMKFWIPRPLRRPAAWFGRLLELWAGLVCSAIVVATPDIARGYPSDRTVMVQNFPDDVEFCRAAATPYAERPVTVAYVGGLSEARGVIEMVLAIGQVGSDFSANLVLGGEFQPSELRTVVERLPGWDRCRAPGRLDRNHVASLLSQTRVGLVVVHPTESYLRIFPVKMFEYMAAGVPIVASDFPLFRELIGSSDCALFVDPLDPTAIAGAIEELLGDPKRAAAMGARGAAAVEREFTWAVQEERLLALYDRLAAA